MNRPTPLVVGTQLRDRYVVDRVLGIGGFAITYLATDHNAHEQMVIKELAPPGSQRNPLGGIEFPNGSQDEWRRLQRAFLEEAKKLGRLSIPGIPALNDYFQELETAYLVTSYSPDSVTLAEYRAAHHPISAPTLLTLLQDLLGTLGELHSKGILHLDIKPTNVILGKRQTPILIDFGSAREWHADWTETQTILFSEHFAALEQFGKRARRGPETDLYGLCATFYELATGVSPVSATDRLNGIELPSITNYRRDLPASFLAALDWGLKVRQEDRPKSAAELLEILDQREKVLPPTALGEFDEALVRLQGFRFEKRACPVCGDSLAKAAQLPRATCPICRSGKLTKRSISDKICPNCRHGVLKELKSKLPIDFCPRCQFGRLSKVKSSLLSRNHTYRCVDCNLVLIPQEDGAVLEGSDTFRTWQEWRHESRRSEIVKTCDFCEAQFDAVANGKWVQVIPKSPYSFGLHEAEWALVAAGLDPGSGNTGCSNCNADFFSDEDFITYLGGGDDRFQIGHLIVGKVVTLDELRWIGAGKVSPRPGYFCHSCHTEFDEEAPYWRLVYTESPRLRGYTDELQTQEDWARLANQVPTISETPQILERIPQLMVESYCRGEIELSPNAPIWKGAVTLIEPYSKSGTLQIDHEKIVLGSFLKKETWRIETIESIEFDEDQLCLTFRGSSEIYRFEIQEVELTVELDSGKYTVTLQAEELAARLRSAVA